MVWRQRNMVVRFHNQVWFVMELIWYQALCVHCYWRDVAYKTRPAAKFQIGERVELSIWGLWPNPTSTGFVDVKVRIPEYVAPSGDVAKSEHCVSHLLEGVLDEQPLQMRLYHDELLYPRKSGVVNTLSCINNTSRILSCCRHWIDWEDTH